MKKYYDKKNARLVYVNNSADNYLFWDSHWANLDFIKAAEEAKNSFPIKILKNYVPRGAKILEGGCGLGDKAFILGNNGYDAYGIDFARETINKINHFLPKLKIALGDVRHLNFDDCFFDGYLSLGVIEHFIDGYDQISNEMYRVLKKKGYLFLTVPTMSLLRKFKSMAGCYPLFNNVAKVRDDFYQFALAPKNIISKFEKKGFKIIEYKHYGGLLGLIDEVKFFEQFLKYIYKNPSILSKIIKNYLEFILKNITNHTSLFIFIK